MFSSHRSRSRGPDEIPFPALHRSAAIPCRASAWIRVLYAHRTHHHLNIGFGAIRTEPDIPKPYSLEATTAAATAARTRLVLRLIDLEGATIEVGAVQRLHRTGRIRIRHLDETEATGASSLTVVDQGYAFDRSMLREQSPNRIIGRRKRQISNI
jgi:hypothetical protein